MAKFACTSPSTVISDRLALKIRTASRTFLEFGSLVEPKLEYDSIAIVGLIPNRRIESAVSSAISANCSALGFTFMVVSAIKTGPFGVIIT